MQRIGFSVLRAGLTLAVAVVGIAIGTFDPNDALAQHLRP
jgi:hypothetical protein